MKSSIVFSGNYLDRTGHLRDDPTWVQRALKDPSSRVLPIWNTRNLIEGQDTPRAAMLELKELPRDTIESQELILLGSYGETSVFTAEIPSSDAPQLRAGTHFEDLRLIVGQLQWDEAGLLGYARAMVNWRRRHQYCGNCGAKTLSAKGGHVRVCSSASCGIQHFPRTDPAIIVLVSDGERALLGRQALWPLGRYSTLAGFVEPGESLEDAVVREVFEETGVVVNQVEYQGSQPWPFPASLMLGFTAQAITTEIQLHDQELEDARWFSRADIAAGQPLLPPSASISYYLIEHWFDAGGTGKLRDNSP